MFRLHLVIFFLIIPVSFSGSSTADRSSSMGKRVEYLPGFQGPLPFYLETGYVGVGENEDVQLFYYFLPSESNPKDDPLILWLTGGPGCSSFSGLVFEIGPLEFDEVPYNGSLPTFHLRPRSWTKLANIIFLDAPVGTGFSYARTLHAYHSTDVQYCDQANEFLRKWFEGHPEFLSNTFYVGGDSYSGLPVPVLTDLIADRNEEGSQPYVNLKGYLLGNPKTFPEEENYNIRFSNGMGLISDELYKSLLHSCQGEYRQDYISSNNIGCLQNVELYNENLDGIEPAHVLKPFCGSLVSPLKLPNQRQLKENPQFYCRLDAYNLVNYWANDATVREALHTRKGTKGDWKRCNTTLDYTKTLDDVRAYHQNLSCKGYRSLIYSGDHDLFVTHLSTQAWIKELNYSVIDLWRSWKVHGQIAGYTESYSNKMTFATVKGSGHTAPEFNPEECFAMLERWISHQAL